VAHRSLSKQEESGDIHCMYNILNYPLFSKFKFNFFFLFTED